MTYCLGMLLDAGLIMIADTRTNAGVDDFSSYRKLHCLVDGPDRCIFAASAGNLSTTQTIISLLREGVYNHGFAFTQYLANTYGEDVLRRVSEVFVEMERQRRQDLAFIQQGGGTASLSEEVASKISVGDIVYLNKGQEMVVDSLIDVLVFTVPDPLPNNIPNFIFPYFV